MKKLIPSLLALIFMTSFIYADQVTENYRMVIPGQSTTNWLAKLSLDIISMDTVMGIISEDFASTFDNYVSQDAVLQSLSMRGAYSFPVVDAASAGYVLSSDALGNATWGIVTAGAGSFATLELDNLGTVAINATLGDVPMDSIDGNTLIVSANSAYDTITKAMTAATAGDTILVAEGTYTETVTFSQDNLTLKAIGSKANTIITQAATNTVTFSTKSGCVLDGFTVSVTAADGNADACILSLNDDTSDYNYVLNCDVLFAKAVVVSDHRAIYVTDGNFEIRDSKVSVSNTYTSTTADAGRCIYFDTTGHIINIRDCHLTLNSTATGTIANIALLTATTAIANITDSTIEMLTAGLTTAATSGLYAGNTTMINARDNYISIDCVGTGVVYGLNTSGTVSTINSYGNTFNCTNADADSVWAKIFTTGTVNSYYDNIVSGDIANAATFNGYIGVMKSALSPDPVGTMPMLYFDTDDSRLKFYIGSSNIWKDITFD